MGGGHYTVPQKVRLTYVVVLLEFLTTGHVKTLRSFGIFKHRNVLLPNTHCFFWSSGGWNAAWCWIGMILADSSQGHLLKQRRRTLWGPITPWINNADYLCGGGPWKDREALHQRSQPLPRLWRCDARRAGVPHAPTTAAPADTFSHPPEAAFLMHI